MTDYYEEMMVSPDPSRAEQLRDLLNARIASMPGDPPHGETKLAAPTTSPGDLDPDRHPGRRWMLVAAAAIVALALGLLAVAAVEESDRVQTDTVPPTPAPSTIPATTSSLPAVESSP